MSHSITASDATAVDSSRPTSVALPKRSPTGGPKAPPVWAITSAAPNVTAPTSAKCSRHQDGRRGVCCKELKNDGDGWLVNTDILRDVVIGLSDGLTVPFALTAGLASLGDSRVVVLGGVAELIAGAISMGIGAFLATQAERDQYVYLRGQTSARVLQSCAGEMEREVDDVLSPLGVPASLSRQVAEALRKEELQYSPLANPTNENEDDEEAQNLRWSQDVGLTPFLLKFGRGIEPIPDWRMYSSAATIGIGYLLGGFIPLLPYLFIQPASTALIYSCIVTGIVLIIFGAVKTKITGSTGKFTDYLYGSLSTLAVGGVAAGAAFGIVKLLAEKE